MLGIHWRHRIVDPTAGYFARAAWDAGLAPDAYYRAYARTQGAGPRVEPLARALTAVDRDRTVLSTFTGRFRDGHAETHEFSGDYNEAFTFWNDYEPPAGVVASQKEVHAALEALAAGAASDFEREKLAYLAGHAGFLVPYTESWTLAHRLHGVLARAGELRKAGRAPEAAALVREEGLPLWLRLAPEVRRAMLAFQRIVATRNDLGTLASKHIKYVRLALHRLPLSIQEYLGEMPAAVEKARAEAAAADPDAPPRLIVPTRPGLLDWRKRARIMILVTGSMPVGRVTLHLRRRGEADWRAAGASLLGRRTWEAFLGPFPLEADRAAYYVSADCGGRLIVAPEDAPRHSYGITIV
jgi:hypothetical protein